MKWHVVGKTGAGDAFFPAVEADEPRLAIQVGRPEGEGGVLREFIRRSGRRPTSEALDLLSLAIAAYVTDLRVPRSAFDDRWTREIHLYVAVGDLAKWQGAAGAVQSLLSFLTGDVWSVDFRQGQVTTTESRAPVGPGADVVELFSGGLDSFVGAIDSLAAGERPALVGHYGAGVAHKFQDEAQAALKAAFGDRFDHWSFYVQPPRQGNDQGEPTMRARSILFLALGVAVATAYGTDVPLRVAENGLISLNVPLASSRIGSLSTRTTHPHFIDSFRLLLAAVGIPTRVELPYLFKTKGEMLQGALDQAALARGVAHTMSCAHPESGRLRGHSPRQHCGYCVPCIIRRASTFAAGVPDVAYRVDVRTNPPSAETGSGRDFRAFELAVRRFYEEGQDVASLRVLDTGPLPPSQLQDFRGVYRRGMEEVARLLRLGPFAPGGSGGTV